MRLITASVAVTLMGLGATCSALKQTIVNSDKTTTINAQTTAIGSTDTNFPATPTGALGAAITAYNKAQTSLTSTDITNAKAAAAHAVNTAKNFQTAATKYKTDAEAIVTSSNASSAELQAASYSLKDATNRLTVATIAVTQATTLQTNANALQPKPIIITPTPTPTPAPAPTPITTSASTLPLLVPGQSYTVGQLLNYIRTNNPQANFYYRPANATDNYNVGNNSEMLTLINNNLTTSVTVNKDLALITYLVSTGQLNTSNKDAYSKIMLYFTLSNTTFYLVKPFPGKIYKTAKTTRIPANDIMRNFNFTKTVYPANLP